MTMISAKDYHWFSHYVQGLLARLDAEMFLSEKTAKGIVGQNEYAHRAKKSLMQLSETFKLYVDFQLIHLEKVSPSEIKEWQKKVRLLISQHESAKQEITLFYQKMLTAVEKITQS